VGIHFGIEKTQLAVAIDGESGSGKTGLAVALAQDYGLLCVPTGKMYRAVAVLTNRRGKPMERSVDAAIEVAQTVKFEYSNGHMVADGEILSDEELGTKEVGNSVSYFAKIDAVRTALVPIQRSIACSRPSVTEGRDITSVVLPDADLKLYVQAKVENRASWRHAELPDTEKRRRDLKDVQRELEERDTADKNRDLAPLIRVLDAEVINSDEYASAEAVRQGAQKLMDEVCASFGIASVRVGYYKSRS